MKSDIDILTAKPQTQTNKTKNVKRPQISSSVEESEEKADEKYSEFSRAQWTRDFQRQIQRKTTIYCFTMG